MVDDEEEFAIATVIWDARAGWEREERGMCRHEPPDIPLWDNTGIPRLRHLLCLPHSECGPPSLSPSSEPGICEEVPSL